MPTCAVPVAAVVTAMLTEVILKGARTAHGIHRATLVELASVVLAAEPTTKGTTGLLSPGSGPGLGRPGRSIGGPLFPPPVVGPTVTQVPPLYMRSVALVRSQYTLPSEGLPGGEERTGMSGALKKRLPIRYPQITARRALFPGGEARRISTVFTDARLTSTSTSS